MILPSTSSNRVVFRLQTVAHHLELAAIAWLMTTVLASPVVGGDWMFGSAKLTPGQTIETELPVPAEFAKTLGDCYGKPTKLVKVAIALPASFDPTKPQRLLITSATTSNDGLSIKDMQTFTAAALTRSWIVMAADGEFGKPGKNDHTGFRGAMLEIMTRELKVRFPQAQTKWSVATAGFSGGAGYASHQALLLSSENWHVIGMLLMNSGYTPVQWEKGNFVKGPKTMVHKIPVFISGGQTDTLAKPDMLRESADTVKHGGYKSLRLEWHDGGHKPSKEHISTALEWFESLDK